MSHDTLLTYYIKQFSEQIEFLETIPKLEKDAIAHYIGEDYRYINEVCRSINPNKCNMIFLEWLHSNHIQNKGHHSNMDPHKDLFKILY